MGDVFNEGMSKLKDSRTTSLENVRLIVKHVPGKEQRHVLVTSQFVENGEGERFKHLNI